MRDVKVAGDIEKVISGLKDLGYTYYEASEHVDRAKNGYDCKYSYKVFKRLIIAFLLLLFTTAGHFFLESKPINETERKIVFTFFLSVPALVITFFIRGSFERFFFERKKWRKTRDNERRVWGLTVLFSGAYVLLLSPAFIANKVIIINILIIKINLLLTQLPSQKILILVGDSYKFHHLAFFVRK